MHNWIIPSVILWSVAAFPTTTRSFLTPPSTTIANVHHFSSKPTTEEWRQPLSIRWGRRRNDTHRDGVVEDEIDAEIDVCTFHSNNDGSNHHNIGRRTVLTAFLSSAALLKNGNPASAAAPGEDQFESPMNGLTRQIRTSVVRGAQLIDKADGKWERFSDDLGLGSERNQPKRNVIDAGGNGLSKKVARSEVVLDVKYLVLDENFAYGLLNECDEAFLSCLKSQQSQRFITKAELERKIDETKQLIIKSFFKAPPTPAEEFNFDCYTHFKVFNEVLINEKVNFPPFKKDFESLIGKRLLERALQQQSTLVPSEKSTTLTNSLRNSLQTTDDIATFLQKKGFITSWERSIPPDDDIEDFTSTAKSSTDNFYVSSDLPYSLALYEDTTLNSQLLLQELGYRMYPAFGRWLVQATVSKCFGGDAGKVSIQIDDYYMDTSYNSNPDLFQVNQVLLNIVIQRD